MRNPWVSDRTPAGRLQVHIPRYPPGAERKGQACVSIVLRPEARPVCPSYWQHTGGQAAHRVGEPQGASQEGRDPLWSHPGLESPQRHQACWGMKSVQPRKLAEIQTPRPLGHHHSYYNMSKDASSWPWLSLQALAGLTTDHTTHQQIDDTRDGQAGCPQDGGKQEASWH